MNKSFRASEIKTPLANAGGELSIPNFGILSYRKRTMAYTKADIKALRQAKIDEAIKGKPQSCRECVLWECSHVFSQVHKGHDNKIQPKVMIVGEAPGAEEVKQGVPFVGMSGDLLNKALEQAGLNRDEVYISNAVECKHPKNKLPKEAIASCRDRLLEEIVYVNPKCILVMGNTPLQSVLEKTGLLKQQGLKYRHQITTDKGTWEGIVAVTVHPLYVLRNPNTALSFFDDVNRCMEPIIEMNAPKWKFITTRDEVSFLNNQILEGDTVAIDLEATDLNPDKGEIICMSVTIGSVSQNHMESERTFIIPWKAMLEHKKILQGFLNRKDICWIYHNGSFDVRWLREKGFKISSEFYDSMIEHYVLYPQAKRRGLKQLAQELLGAPDWDASLEPYLKKKNKSFADVPIEILSEYAAWDTRATLDLHTLLNEQINTQNDGVGAKLYKQILQPSQNTFSEIERYGMLIDLEMLRELKSEYLQLKSEKLEVIRDEVTISDFNPNSTKQVREELYDRRKLPVLGRTPKGEAGTGAAVLTELFDITEDDLVQKILDFRQLGKIISTYLEGIETSVDSEGVYHPSYRLSGTVTGRLTAGTVLTIPRGTKNQYAGKIRDLFVARPGCKMIASDYKQAELRVLACLAEETAWRPIFENNRDLHGEMAGLLFGEGWTKEQRGAAKAFNFGLVYGRSAQSIAKELDWTVKEAENFVARYFKAVPNIERWMQEQRDLVLKEGKQISHFGRVMEYGIITHKNHSNAMNLALNFPVQSTANDMCLISTNEVFKEIERRGLSAHVVFYMHDSIMVEAADDCVEEVSELLSETMQSVPAKHFSDFAPFGIDLGIGQSWGETERVK